VHCNLHSRKPKKKITAHTKNNVEMHPAHEDENPGRQDAMQVGVGYTDQTESQRECGSEEEDEEDGDEQHTTLM
jgi:hypothetical protein